MLSQLMMLFGFFALVLVAVYWVNRAVQLFDRLIADGQSAWTFLEFTALTLPYVIRIVLPSAATAAAFEAATGLELCQGFAPPGTAGLATCNPINGKRVAGSVGLPMPGVDLRLGQGLELAGPNLACDGWLAAARRARVDEAGFLYIGSSRP